MVEAEIRERYGWAEIDPDRPVTAGATGTWRIVYHAGRYGVDDGGVIKIAWRDVSDWEAPRFDDPAAAGYASVSTTGPASLRPAFEKQRYVRPWRRCVTIDVFDDSLSEGDTVTLILGDTSGGSPGIRAQTFCKDRFEFRVAVDWCGTWVYVEVPSPAVPIVSGAPHKLVAVCASETAPGESAWVGIKAEDEWGNPCRDYTGEVTVDADGLSGLPETFGFRPEDRGTRRFDDVRAPESGVFRIGVSDRRLGLNAISNPLRCVENGTGVPSILGRPARTERRDRGNQPGFVVLSLRAGVGLRRLRRTSGERLSDHRSRLGGNPDVRRTSRTILGGLSRSSGTNGPATRRSAVITTCISPATQVPSIAPAMS